MLILSWNVNGLGARLEAIKRLSQELCPEIMCFQKRQVIGSWSIVDIPGYMGLRGQVNTSRLLFGGVSTYFRKYSDFETVLCMPIDGWLGETGNIQVFYFNDFFLVNAYVPYSNATDPEWIQIRQYWDIKFHETLCNLAKHKPLIVCGDLNIVSQDIDAWDGVSVKKAGCFYEWEHRNFASILKATGLVDSYRMLHPHSREYSYFFQNRLEYRIENKGFRMDYFLVSEALMPYVKKSEILTDVSDTTNSPILLEIEFPNHL